MWVWKRVSGPCMTLACLLCQVCQVSAQQPVQTELLMRYHQLQSRLATLKIENEEVRGWVCGQHCWAFLPLEVSWCAQVWSPSCGRAGGAHRPQPVLAQGSGAAC